MSRHPHNTPESTPSAPVPADRPPWADRPMRWAQMAFVADDPVRYDPAFWLDYFKRTKVQGVCLSAGGCMAFYPTQVQGHYRSPFLGDGDPFGDLVDGCRESGLVVLARTDPHACHETVAKGHPEWIAADAEGRPRRHWSHPEYWVTCTLGPYSFDFMARVTDEVVGRYDVDGVFCNRWAGSGPCYCESCREQFNRWCGRALPRPGDATARLAEYKAWREQRLMELWELWDRRITAIRPEARFVPNVGGGALFELDMAACGRRAVMMVADRQGRRGAMAPWAVGKNAREYRAVLGDKPAAGLFSVGVEEAWRWKDSVQAEPELRIWMLEGIAQGLRPWYIKFSGVVRDPRWLAPVESIFQWHARHEKYMRHQRNLARIGLVYSQQTARHYGGANAVEMVERPIDGAFQAMLEARMPFDMVHDRLLDADSLARYRLLVLANTAALSDRQCEQIAAFVKRGGSVVATFETSRYDEQGRPRDELGLAGLLGVSLDGDVEAPMRNAYLQLNHPHPVLAGLEDAPRIIHGVRRLPVRPRVDFPSPVMLVPSYPDLPMEEVYPRTPGSAPGSAPGSSAGSPPASAPGSARVEESIVRELYLREQALGPGSGRVAYFNWDIDRTFHEVQAPDHGRLLANTLAWALDEPPVVEVEGRGMIDIALWRQADSITLHLVNLTNPHTMRGPYRELIPSPPQRIRLRVPEGSQPAKVHLLVAGAEVPWQGREGCIELEVQSILDHEVVAVDLS